MGHGEKSTFEFITEKRLKIDYGIQALGRSTGHFVASVAQFGTHADVNIHRSVYERILTRKEVEVALYSKR
jgi:hypothetical protein